MRTIKLPIFFISLFVFSLNSMSQDLKKVNLGVGLDLGTEVDETGLDWRIGYLVTKQINIVFDMNIFFLEEGSQYISNRHWNEFNLNGHYYFLYDKTILAPYGLAGINITNYGFQYDNHPTLKDSKESTTEIGLNVGAGLDFNFIDRLKPFVEFKYLLIKDYDQAEVAVGLKFFFLRD